MPPSDFLLPHFPAEEDDATVAKMGKITKPHVEILDDDPQLMDCLDIGTYLLEAGDIECADGTSSPIFGSSTRFPNIFFGSNQRFSGLLDRSQT